MFEKLFYLEYAADFIQNFGMIYCVTSRFIFQIYRSFDLTISLLDSNIGYYNAIPEALVQILWPVLSTTGLLVSQ